jgi:hypothetical protein
LKIKRQALLSFPCRARSFTTKQRHHTSFKFVAPLVQKKTNHRLVTPLQPLT